LNCYFTQDLGEKKNTKFNNLIGLKKIFKPTCSPILLSIEKIWSVCRAIPLVLHKFSRTYHTLLDKIGLMKIFIDLCFFPCYFSHLCYFAKEDIFNSLFIYSFFPQFFQFLFFSCFFPCLPLLNPAYPSEKDE
jgi:hypothetical protein